MDQHFDSLEPRRLLAASAVVRTDDLLTITGSDQSDHISIAAGRRVFQVLVNGRQWDVAAPLVRTVRIYGGSGNDEILVSPNFRIRCSIDAGFGNDLVTGGRASDSIWGQAGNDTLNGNQGSDYIDAGDGDDSFNEYISTAQDNVLHGGRGNDRAICFAQDYTTGIENLSVPATRSVLEVKNGKILLTLTADNGNDGDFKVDPLVERSPGVFVLHETHTRSNWSFTYAPISVTIDITPAKGSKLIIERQHYWLDVSDDVQDRGTESLLLFSRL